jgi:mono/diheme cytochrome c family protein
MFPAGAQAQSLHKRGKYLMNTIVACGNCHTPQTPNGPEPGRELAGGAPFKEPFGTAYASNITPKPDDKGVPDFANKTGGGGMSFSGPWGVSYAPNITPGGIGKWSNAQIKKAITTGVRPDGTRLKPPMAFHYYKSIRKSDLDAIVAYLRTLKGL